MPFSGIRHKPRYEFGADSASNKACVFDLRQLFPQFVFFLQQTNGRSRKSLQLDGNTGSTVYPSEADIQIARKGGVK